MGPPESPWHESLPPAVTPAQNIVLRQVARETMGTSTLRRVVGEDPPAEVVPQPATVEVLPEAGSEPEAAREA
jgi:hypothetical protein